MTIADHAHARPDGRTNDFTTAMSKMKDRAASMTDAAIGKMKEAVPLSPAARVQRMARSPHVSVPVAGKKMKLATDRVRAKPALTPTLSMNIGMTAIGLGVWGLLFPNSVKRSLGVAAPAAVVRTIFGLRELITGFTLAGDPTKSEMLWTRVAGDAFDLTVLKMLDNPKNPSRGGARAAFAFVAAVTALDVLAAVRMTNVKRNCE